MRTMTSSTTPPPTTIPDEEAEEERLPPTPDASSASSSVLWQTRVRQAVRPYLPPPVVQAVEDRVDPELARWGLGPEGTVTIVSTVVAAWLVWRVLRFLASLSSSGKAIVDDDEEEDDLKSGKQQRKQQEPPAKSTVLLVGPANAGKTQLFYRLCYGPQKKSNGLLPTVTSLKPNVGTDNNKRGAGIRYVDWPGHRCALRSGGDEASSFLETDAALTSSQLWSDTAKLLSAHKVPAAADKLRLVLVLDATQPVKDAAAILYQVWYSVAQATATSSSSAAGAEVKFPVVIACHKQDAAKCKNARRIKIQLRTELEKLAGARQPAWLTLPPGGLELNDTMPHLKLHFLETSLTDKADEWFQPLQQFCETGTLLSHNETDAQ